MSLRQRLALGFLLFSALPLTGFALFTYTSSRSALRAAARAEAEIAARDLEQRVGRASDEIAARFRALSDLPLATWTEAEAGASPPALETALADLGPALAFVEQLRFVPLAAPLAPAAPTARTPPVAPVPTVAAAPAVAPIAPLPPLPGFGVAREAQEARQMKIVLAGVEARVLERLGADPARAETLRHELARMRAEIAKTVEASRRAALEDAAAERARAAAESRSVAARAAGDGHAGKSGGAALAVGTVACELGEGDRVLGTIEGKVKARELLRSVLEQTDRERGEIPFAIAADAKLLAASEDDAAQLESLPAVRALRGMPAADGKAADGDWIVLTRQDPASGVRFGIAHPLGAAIAELRGMVARNLLFGAGLITLTLAGFLPLTGSLVRDVRALERGADAIAAGDLAARVDVRRSDEIGRLGAAFNNMAAQVAGQREQLLAEERRRKEDEIARRLLAAENERRGRELEEARDFQLSLLPRELPRLPDLDVAVDMTTATEVGGDYYDFQTAPGGGLVVAIGDATGHGAAAGTMVTAVKSLFAATAASQPPAEFLTSANAAIHRMGLVRRAMALSIARVDGREVVMSAAGMPPLLHYRAGDGAVVELAPAGTPLGARADFPYTEARCTIGPGDALLLLTDGLPELPNADGEPFGYERLRARFNVLAAEGDCAAAIVAGLRQTAREWGGAASPGDDITLLVLHARPA